MSNPDVTADAGILRSAVTIGAWNGVSRVTGFARVLAVGGALGTTFVGNTYQTANLVSNLLFELLAAGLLAAPLVPVFVALVDDGRTDELVDLGGVLLGLSLAVLGVVVVAGMVLSPAIMRALTLAVGDPELRDAEVRVGAFLLRFFLPQVLLYAALAIATAVLNAHRRFAAGAVAPVANNLVVIATMLTFAAVRAGAAPTMALPTVHRLVLGVGTTAGVVAMAAIPTVAAARRGLRLRPRWDPRHPRIAAILRTGAWGAVVLAAVQVLIVVTLVLANRVRGGVVAYQIAFTFFLLPVALAAHPIFTALYPRLAAHAHAGRWRAFAADLEDGMRRVLFLVIPASAALAVLGTPALRVIRIGALDRGSAELVGHVLAAYAVGLAGYGSFLLLTRAWTAAGDPRVPALVAAGVAVGGAALMVVGSSVADGEDRVVALGVAHSIAMTAGAAVLYVLLRRRCGGEVRIVPTLARSVATAVAGALAAVAVVDALDRGGRTAAATAAAAGAVAIACVVLAGQWVLRGPELNAALRVLRERT